MPIMIEVKPLQIIRRISEIVGRACLHGEMVWMALLAQGLLWLQSRLFPRAKEPKTELQRTISKAANNEVEVVCQTNINKVFHRVFSRWLVTGSFVVAGLGVVLLMILVKR